MVDLSEDDTRDTQLCESAPGLCKTLVFTDPKVCHRSKGALERES